MLTKKSWSNHFLYNLSCLILTATFAAYAYSHAAGHEIKCEEGMSHQHDLGDYTVEISSKNEQARRLFNEGINWAYGFNHAEAEVKFREAVANDPNCAICYWGVAYVLGPNINAPMAPETVPEAYSAMQSAIALMDQGSKLEQSLIKALEKRYSKSHEGDRSELDKAYADAMMSLVKEYPENLEVAALAVDATMNTMPWNYWLPGGQPQEGTEEMIDLLNRVLEINPIHPGANHFLIHVVEKERPELGIEAADRLVDLVPEAGHLQHMAAHIYIRVGRYYDSVLANQRAIKADMAYLAACPQEGIYPDFYVPHNYEFLMASAFLLGNRDLALRTAKELKTLVEPTLLASPESFDFQQFWSAPYLTYLRFGEWGAMLDEAAPSEDWAFARALWHLGRALAASEKSDYAKSLEEIQMLEAIAKRPEMAETLLAGLNPASQILAIGVEEAKGSLAARQLRYDAAIGHFERAVHLQDSLTYIEPPAWYRSMRLPLGEALQASGRHSDAERVFREDLEEFPANGWALSGLYRSLSAQKRVADASQVWESLQQAWQHADIDVP